MQIYHHVKAFFRRMQTFPLSLLNLSIGKRLLIVTLSYVVGIPGLWFTYPLLNNGLTMLLPIICLCWLFLYRGLLISTSSTVVAVLLVAHYLVARPVSGQLVLVRGVIGLGVTIFLGLTICWLRSVVDLVQAARQRALIVERERLKALEGEYRITLAYEQQRKINELKDQFLLNVSHELRTPLTVLGGSLEILNEYHERLDQKRRAKVLMQALASQQALTDLVNRVVDTTSIVSEIPPAKLEAVCVYPLLQEVLGQLAPDDVEAYTLCLRVPEDLMVRADPQFLRQVLNNVLSNIFKYVPRQTEISIEATQAASSSEVCLSIQDAGPGIPVEELPLLFEKFVRLKRDLAGTMRGMGLGLYICRRLVEAMEGRIWVESTGRPGEGSRFCLTLPPVSLP